jgi:hypothetical protein
MPADDHLSETKEKCESHFNSTTLFFKKNQRYASLKKG